MMKKIFALALLGSTFVLTACGGNSDSSGSDNNDAKKTHQKENMSQQLDGYWREYCHASKTKGMYKSLIVHFKKIGDNEVLRKEGYEITYKDSKCLREAHYYTKYKVLTMDTNKYKKRGSYVNNNKLKIVLEKGEVLRFHRIDADEFNSFKKELAYLEHRKNSSKSNH